MDEAEARTAEKFGGTEPAGAPDAVLRAEAPVPVWKVLKDAGFVVSTSEARRLIQQGGVEVNHRRVADVSEVLTAAWAWTRRWIPVPQGPGSHLVGVCLRVLCRCTGREPGPCGFRGVRGVEGEMEPGPSLVAGGASNGPVDLWYDKYHRLVRQEFTDSGHKTIVQLENVRR